MLRTGIAGRCRGKQGLSEWVGLGWFLRLAGGGASAPPTRKLRPRLHLVRSRCQLTPAVTAHVRYSVQRMNARGTQAAFELQSEIPPEHEWKSSKSEPYHSGFLQRAQHPVDSTKLWMPQTASSEMVQLSGHRTNKTGCSREVVVIVKLNTHIISHTYMRHFIHTYIHA